MPTVLFEPGSQAHYDYLLGHRARVEAGELLAPVATRESIAEHEAAHATVSAVLNIAFGEVVVLPVDQWRAGRSAGWSRAKVIGKSREDVLIRGCAALWAGAIVDGHLYGAGGHLDGGHNDIEQIVAGSSLLPEDKQGIPFSLSAYLVTRFRPSIRAVAGRLVESGRLTHAEVVRIVHATARPN